VSASCLGCEENEQECAAHSMVCVCLELGRCLDSCACFGVGRRGPFGAKLSCECREYAADWACDSARDRAMGCW
jgi:hypothetical protein